LATATGSDNTQESTDVRFLSTTMPQPAPTSPSTTVREAVISSTIPTSRKSKAKRSHQQRHERNGRSATAVRGSSRYYSQGSKKNNSLVTRNRSPKQQSVTNARRNRKEQKNDRENIQTRVSKEISELEKALVRHEVQLNKMFSQGNPQARLQQISQNLHEKTLSHGFDHGRVRPQKKRASNINASRATSKLAREKELATSLMQTLATGGTRENQSDTVPLSILPVGEEFAQLQKAAFTLYIPLSAGIPDLKMKIFDAMGIDPDEQILLFKGRRLEDKATLSECKIEAQAQLRLITGRAIHYTGNDEMNGNEGFASSGIPYKSALRSGGSRSAERLAPKEPVRFSTASPEVRTRPWTPFEDVRDMFYTEEEVNNFRAEAERESMENAMFEYDGDYEYQVEESGTFLRDLQEYTRQEFGTYHFDEVGDENSSNLAEEDSQQNLEGPSLFEGGMSTDGGAQFEGDGEEYDSDSNF
jgi:hypothetical protein